MKPFERRKELALILTSKKSAVSGSDLAKELNCSRQIIVSDIAILKASGYDIISTNRGYIINSSPLCERVYKVKHTSKETEEELKLIVGLGGIVADVFVWHKVYGKIKADLNIFSLSGVDKFIEGIKSGKSTELMHITDGYHYHTVKADSFETLTKIEEELNKKNFIVPEI
ncbi:MAG: transcription repressor NadR [Ruminococcaceae bacterium]|nr:transcription repressor NadR [Oscillospiraceae bacterium]